MNNTEIEILNRRKFGIVENSNYDKLLSKIVIDVKHDPKDVFKIKTELIKRSINYLENFKNNISNAVLNLWNGGEFVYDFAVIAVINGWYKLPESRYKNNNWFQENATGTDDTSVQIVADAVASIQKQDRKYTRIKFEKDSETKRKRKITKKLKEMGYVQMYVNPKDIEIINNFLKDLNCEKMRFENQENNILRLKHD